MATEKKIFEKFSKYGFEIGNEFYLQAQRVNSFIESCISQGVAILGVEGFAQIDHGKFQGLPIFQEFKSTFNTWPEYCVECDMQARSFFQNKTFPDDIYFNFTVVDKISWLNLQKTKITWNKKL